MLVTILSWIIIFMIFYTTGFSCSNAITKIFGISINTTNKIIAGMVFSTVFAECFSIFSRVGKTAILILACYSIVVIVYSRNLIKECLTESLKEVFENSTLIILFIIVIFLGAFLTSQQPSGFDVYNYDAQSIRWIEEYGVVKGLGNLHTRFAYNSSFLCLQGLFSFSWINGISLHSVNGFIWTFFVISNVYSLCVRKKHFFSLSNILRIIFLFFLFRIEELKYIQSPNTDFLPLCLIAHIFIEWTSLDENETKCNEDIIRQGLLCMLGLFCVTTKLSAAILILLVIKPIIEFFKKRKIKHIIVFIAIGVVIILPFVIRNVIISGYLLYPVTAIDIFNVDWKIPAPVVKSDSMAIKLFARAWGYDWSYIDETRTFFDWFNIWITRAEDTIGLWGLINLLLAPILLLILLIKKINGSLLKYDYTIFLTAACGYLFLILSAPSIRFGRWWFFVLPICFVYSLIDIENLVLVTASKDARMYSFLLIIISIGYVVYMSIIYIPIMSESILITPADYIRNGSDGDYYLIGEYRFYYYSPNDSGKNNLNSYDGFPGTECKATLEKIELRGKMLSEGFRATEESKKTAYDFQGAAISSYVLAMWGLNDYYEIPRTELNDYEIEENAIDYFVDSENQTNKGLQVEGWAVINGVDMEDSTEICIETKDKYIICTKVSRQDVMEARGLSDSNVGFKMIIDGDEDFQICVIDHQHKIIYE